VSESLGLPHSEGNPETFGNARQRFVFLRLAELPSCPPRAARKGIAKPKKCLDVLDALPVKKPFPSGTQQMKTESTFHSHFTFWLVVAGWCVTILSAIPSATAQVNVTQFHNHASRDGLYVDSAFTPGAAANLTRDLNFDGTIIGDVYAQPLYLDDGPGGRPTIIAVTESNNVYALDAVDGSVIWERNMGDPVLEDDLT
jgi:hypothetical protein